MTVDVNPNEALTLHRRALGWKYILVALFMVALGGSVFWIGPEEGEVGIVVVAILCILLGLLGIAAVVMTKRKAGQPMITLSPEGVNFEVQGGGPVAWHEVTGLGSISVKGQSGLIVRITDEAHARVVPSRAMRSAAKLDQALLGSKGLTVWHNQIEGTLDELVVLIAIYSNAHGGPDLMEAA
ncbi:STM3941 family protein [Gymnodinialimonas hymeniacidonis]|uniref:STM3941 family protein n=1 Tax=Gymnodinialimonas hymeniacidonis TaxID=3126508 RepID=UPI0034C5B202